MIVGSILALTSVIIGAISQILLKTAANTNLAFNPNDKTAVRKTKK